MALLPPPTHATSALGNRFSFAKNRQCAKSVVDSTTAVGKMRGAYHREHAYDSSMLKDSSDNPCSK
jgi:hypothetical protein